jgi:hypothetical protein
MGVVFSLERRPAWLKEPLYCSVDSVWHPVNIGKVCSKDAERPVVQLN